MKFFLFNLCFAINPEIGTVRSLFERGARILVLVVAQVIISLRSIPHHNAIPKGSPSSQQQYYY